MPKEELLQRKKKEESNRKLAEWDAMIPDGAFQDANISENLTSRHIDKTEYKKHIGTSSLERCRES
jgi:hypothetical protein|tara:strand:- start:875 stop:1072 length:198 start_codon:yes stop_codon:yes gene_type:complete